AFFYNSSYWGQIEAVPLVFLLIAFYGLLFTDKFLLAAVFFSLTLLTKQTAIIFTPLFALGYLFRFGVKKSLAGLAAFLITFFTFFLPFYRAGNLLFFPFATYLNKIQTGSGSDLVTDHAFNFWGIVTGFAKISDSRPFWLGISFSAWGYIIFGILTAIILFRFFRQRQDPASFIFAAGLIPFTGFLFLTRMHERYLEQALPFLLLLLPFGKKYLASFLFLSLFYWLNLYHNWWAPRIPVLVEVLSNAMVINILIAVAILTFFFLLGDYLMRGPSSPTGKKISSSLQ
ncbi:MAG: hypothetical protein Q8N98_00100, partial [bacterium]|nr:hypothetical protein [bacterium]